MVAMDISIIYRSEQAKYAKHQQKAVKQPKLYFSIITDGMDQAKTSLPHIPSNPKCLAGEYSLPTHLTGVNIHGMQPVIFIDWGQFPHDSNLTINVILQIIVRYKVCTYM